MVIFMFYHRQGEWLIALLRGGEEPAEVTASVSRPRKIYDKASLILIHSGLGRRERGHEHSKREDLSWHPSSFLSLFTVNKFYQV